MPSKRSRRTTDMTSAPPPPPKPFLNTTEKADEELELEAALFGKKRKRVNGSKKGNGGGSKGEEGGRGEEEVEQMGSGSLAGFFGDDVVGSMPGVQYGNVNEEDEGLRDIPDDQLFVNSDEEDLEAEGSRGSSYDSYSNSQSDSDSDSDSESSSSSRSQTSSHHSFTSPKPLNKPSLWNDPSDQLISHNLLQDKRLRKTVRGTKDAQLPLDTTVSGTKLEGKLREQFEKMHPTPNWASVAKGKSKQVSAGGEQSPVTAQSLLAGLLSTSGSISTGPKPRGLLSKGQLDVKRHKDANFQNRTGNEREGGGGVKVVKWHPSVGCLAVVGGDKRMRMFSIDGHTNASLLTLHIPSLPLTSASFHPSGTSLLLAGPKPYYYTYDLRSQRCLRSPRNLFGNQSTLQDRNLEKSFFSPDGSMLAIAARRGAVYILSWSSSGAGSLIMTLKNGRQGGIKDICWRKGGREIWVLGEGSEVDVWDLAERRCVWRWRDDGGFGGNLLKGSADGLYCAIGSSTGIVNVYEDSTIQQRLDSNASDISTLNPKPIRSLMNLTTSISTVSFNHDGQIMAIASDKKQDAFRMFHLPSATAFTNWPTSSTPLGVVTSADFSAGSEYVAIGNTRGKVLLYSLEHYRLT